jgi:hypothetical protein
MAKIHLHPSQPLLHQKQRSELFYWSLGADWSQARFGLTLYIAMVGRACSNSIPA